MYENALDVTADLIPVGDLPFTSLYPPPPPPPPPPPSLWPLTHHPALDAPVSERTVGLQAL